MKINILDCTLRDGGYINDWAFTNSQINNILNSLKQSKIDIIECGYLNNKKGRSNHSTLFDTTNTADSFINNIKTQKKVVMINFGDYDIDLLPNCKDTLIDGIRVAFHKKDLNEALDTSIKIANKGYEVYFQPMVTKNYTDLEFLSLIEKVNKTDFYAFYIVDSFGSMELEEFQRYMILADNNLKKEINLGYHSHNNMQLAFSNAINMCKFNFKRDIIIDSSIYGVGRGAGNLNSELITGYLNNTTKTSYDIIPLLEVIDQFLSDLIKEKPWGFSPAQYLSASFNCHPNYATHLINKNTNHIVGVKKILENIPKEKRLSFDKELIEKLYINSLLENKTSVQNKIDLGKSKNILLVASGKSVQEYRYIIDTKKKENYILIALNHIPDFSCDYYFFSNQKRFDEFSKDIDQKRTIITSNIFTTSDIPTVLEFSKLVFVDNVFIKNVAIVAINFLISKGIKKVEIVGLDGYKINSKNYHYKETSVIHDNSSLIEENNIIANGLKVLEKNIIIELLTPSEFKKDIALRILGVIPARYKSSRFEGKPLCIIKDIPMIKRTYTQASQSKLLTKLVVATDSTKIKKYCQSQNIPVVMTSEDCLTGTDRIAQVSQSEHYDLYVNIQGDEPVIDPISIDEIVSDYKTYGDKYVAYNLYKKISTNDEIKADTIIKTIVNEKDELIYMSRLGIPFNKSKKEPTFKKQVCVYGFTKKALELFSSRDKTLNETHEDIEILRFLDMGYKVKMRETTVDSIAVDIPEDVKKVEEFLDKKGLK
ncbi:MAG: 3-deoxy-manno-octulosonate cytidylyltransferase [Campylobacterota bacterium]|nr:3-deoxy-manno-octulosonate cytidylyltransferase [Campylobacterota bacterium]